MNSKIFALLCDRGSLTERFKQVMGVTPKLTKLKQGKQFVSSDERKILGIKPRNMALVREIKMSKNEQCWLFARTVIPMHTLTGNAMRVSMLNNKPIGKILFGRNGATRKSMSLELTQNIPLSITQLGIEVNHPLWQRRSIFEFSTGALMVSEIFLPDCPIYVD